MNECRECKDWRTCIGRDGYLFAHLRFCPFQCLWVLANADTLHTGKWPPQYSPFEEPKTGQLNEEGYFVKPAIIIAEVEKRLGTTPTSLSSFHEGKLLYAQAKAGETLETIDDDAWHALMYIKGKDRKVLSFQKWKRHYRK